MTLDTLYSYCDDLSLLSADTLPEVQALYEVYPYSSTLGFLYLANLALTRDLRYTSELRRLALALPSRRRLYRLTAGMQRLSGLDVDQTCEEKSKVDPFSLVEEFLDEMQASGADLPTELTYSRTLEPIDDYFNTNTQGAEVVDVELFPPLTLPTEEVPRGQMAQSPLMPIPPVAADSAESLDEELFTETLARIYIQQGRYEKAVRIIRSISLHYPEKSAYFADQLRFLEKLIENEKYT